MAALLSLAEKEDQYQADLRAYETKIGPKVTPRRPEPSVGFLSLIVLLRILSFSCIMLNHKAMTGLLPKRSK